MGGKKLLMKLDERDNSIPVWRDFKNEIITISETGVYQDVEIPEDAAEGIFRSSNGFNHRPDSNSSDSFEVTKEKIQFASRQKLQIKGKATQKIYVTWGLL